MLFNCYHFPVGQKQGQTLSIMCDRMFPHFDGEWVSKPEIIYTRFEEFKKYQGATILMLAGGPSVNSFDWNTEDYDYCWSLNHFFLNKKIANIKLDLIVLSAEVKLSHEKLQAYINKHEPWVGFESHHRWLRSSGDTRSFYDTSRMFAMATRFYGKLGGGIRQLILAAELGAKEVFFIGLDGPGPIIKGEHGFEPGKKNLPSQVNSKNAHQVFMEQYTEFWAYMKKYFPNTRFISLDSNNEYHQSCQ